MSASSLRATFAAQQEVRLALVLYGGVSLAVYMNGVTRELFELVRATTPDASGSEVFCENLGGAGEVYRKLGRMLGSNVVPLQALKPDDPVRTRFVIDVISGTSAGGINGVVLAKALANQQKIDTLPELWLKQADLECLINDSQSLIDRSENLKERGIKLKSPEALLNGQRLYLKVLDALEAMDDLKPMDTCRVNSPSLYVDELDLFVTTTDLDGLSLPLQLANEAVIERRYKNVFHLVYARESASGEARNDFEQSNNPFLAFAARCTSSFPFAFEPMRLDDIKTLDPYRGKEKKFKDDVDAWQKLYRPYSPENFPQRSFGDGGYLNNKPFSYATETLLRRRANLRTYRKLIYVEPSPEKFAGVSPADKPDAISNVMKAIVTLPGYETIRQDIESVHERNRLIERVRSITDDVDRDVQQAAPRPPNPASGEKYGNSDLAIMIGIKGISYGGYHRLKVSAVTDELASLIARIARKEDSRDYEAIRELVAAWRRKNYTDYLNPALPKDSQQSENRFLIDFDLSYRLRRINFLRTKIEELFGFDREMLREKAKLIDSDQTLAAVIKNEGEFTVKEFRQELRTIKKSLNDTFVELRHMGRDLRAGRSKTASLGDLIAAAIIGDRLKPIVDVRTSEERRTKADKLLKDPETASAFEAIAKSLKDEIRPAAEKAAKKCGAALAKDSESRLSVVVARSWIGHYYEYYDDYDMITFPITYGTDAGEATQLDIIRISPVDAKSLVDETKSGAPGKLAGTVLFHFGGFLDELWRRNDMLWGRLDAAECIINMMLPDRKPDADQLVEQAHKAILEQELADPTAGAQYRTLVEKLKERLADKSKAAPDIVKAHPPDRERMARNVSRGTTAVGTMFDNIVKQRGLPGHQASAWLARAGALLWGLVEISVADGWAHLVFRRWLTLLYVFELLFLIVGGIIFGDASAEKFGLVTLGVTFAVNLVVVLSGAFLSDRRWLRRFLSAFSIALTILFVLGVVELMHLITWSRLALSNFKWGVNL